MASTQLDFMISIIGVLIFAGLTAYDTQKIKNMYLAGDNNEAAGKGSELTKRIEELAIKTDNLYVFGAGEAKQISSIRKILKQKFDLKADQMSFTGYWKRTD